MGAVFERSEMRP